MTESRHLVDIVNQLDFVEDIGFDREKLGQPMVKLNLSPAGVRATRSSQLSPASNTPFPVYSARGSMSDFSVNISMKAAGGKRR